MRGRRTLGLVAVTWLCAAASAHAADRFVTATGSDANACTALLPCLTVQRGLDAAAASGDRVVVGAGTFSGHATTTKRVDVVGHGSAGAGATILAADDASPTLHLQGGGSVSHVDVRGPNGGVALQLDSTTAATPALTYAVSDTRVEGAAACPTCGGLLLAGPNASVPNRPVTVTIDHVDVATGNSGGIRIDQPGASAAIRNTTVAMNGGFVQGVEFNNGADGSVTDSTVSGVGNAFEAAGTNGSGPDAPERANMTLTRVHADVSSTALFAVLGKITAVDSVIHAGSGVVTQSLSPPDGAADVVLRGDTLYIEGSGGTIGVQAFQGAGVNPSTVELTNTIVRTVKTGASAMPVTDLEASGAHAAITASHSSFTTTVVTGGAPAGAVPTAGAGTNLSGDPLLAAPTTGNFRLAPSSPLIDKGDASVVTAGETDFAGAARALDGNGDCKAVPDVGAYEAPAEAAARCPGAPPPRGKDHTPPTLSGVAFSPATFRVARAPRKSHKGKVHKARSAKHRRARTHRRGSHLKATVSEAGTLEVTLARCRNKRCTRTKRAGALLFTVRAGRNSLAFSARLGRKHKALKLGRYRASVVAVDAAKNRSLARSVRFTIVAH